MRNMMKLIAIGAFLGYIFSSNPVQAQAGIKLNVRGGYYKEQKKPYIGGGINVKIISITFAPNIEYVFVDSGQYYTLNLDGHFNIVSPPGTSLWLGGGLGRLYVKPDGGETSKKTVYNFYGGFGLDALPLDPYIQAKFILSKNLTTQLVLSVGIRL